MGDVAWTEFCMVCGLCSSVVCGFDCVMVSGFELVGMCRLEWVMARGVEGIWLYGLCVDHGIRSGGRWGICVHG